jgi:hypothetical protein
MCQDLYDTFYETPGEYHLSALASILLPYIYRATTLEICVDEYALPRGVVTPTVSLLSHR